VGVAGFPEGHVACREGKHADWRHLKEKVEAGADFVVTQLFFDNTDFFEFRDYVSGALGVRVPLVPGVISILSAAQITKFTQLCGAKLPPALRAKLDALAADDEAAMKFGIEYATRQCAELLRAGVPGLHFYTLNKAPATLQVLKNLGLA
jgi:methylenetetrahydrofolate reductase (NADPH)